MTDMPMVPQKSGPFGTFQRNPIRAGEPGRDKTNSTSVGFGVHTVLANYFQQLYQVGDHHIRPDALQAWVGLAAT